MKIGLISDIHGDLKALDRTLTLLKKCHHVDAIWCAGDLVGRGEDSDAVVSRIMDLLIPCVLGNHDETALMILRRTHVPIYKPETLQHLTLLPRTLRMHLDGRNVVMVHGTPLSNRQSVRLMPGNGDRALRWLGRTGAHVLITGHTHVPYQVQDERGLVVNPGSLFNPSGSDRSSSETYGVLNVREMDFAHYPVWD